jgi:hypothetical protein
MAHYVPVPESVRELIRDFLVVTKIEVKQMREVVAGSLLGLPNITKMPWKKLGIRKTLMCKERYIEAMIMANFDPRIEIVFRDEHYNEMMAEQGSKRAKWVVDSSKRYGYQGCDWW